MEKAILALEPRKINFEEFDRVYSGNEFCQNLLPSLETFKKRIEHVENNGKKWSLVTPYVTSYGLEKLKVIFDYLKG